MVKNYLRAFVPEILKNTFGDTDIGIVRRYQPRFTVWENVPGVLNTRDNAFGHLLGGIVGADKVPSPNGGKGQGWGNAGFIFGPERVAAWRVLDAQYFGVPQRRRRVFLIASPREMGFAPYQILFEPESLCGNPPKGGKAGEEVARSLRGQPQSSHREDSDNFVVMAHGQGNAEICRDGAPSLTCNHEAPIVCEPMTAHTLRGEGFDASEDGTGRGTPIVAIQPKASVSQSMNPSETCPTIGTTKEPAVLTLVIRGRQDGSTLECRDDGKANAILTPNGGRGGIGVGAIAPDTIVRRLTPMECERLQGFPDNYTRIPWRATMAKGPSYEAELLKRGKKLREPTVDKCPDGPRYKALGNSMAVSVVRWIGKRIQLWESLVKSGKIKA